MTSPDVNDADSLATIDAGLDAGINFLDTAYAYGAGGESERLIGKAIRNRRDQVVLATKAGLHWNEQAERVFDGRPERLRTELEESLRRLGTDRVELLYLHAPDPECPVEQSADGLRTLVDAGKTRAIGVSNLSIEQMRSFHAICPIAACQPPYNMLQRDIENDIVPWCREHGVAVVVYWPLLKGLLAGKLARDQTFPSHDGRRKYPMFQGDEFQKNLDFVDELRNIADQSERTVAELVVNWTIHQPGITAALCGAKRATQIQEAAAALRWEMDAGTMTAIQQAIDRRGPIKTRSAV